MKKIFVLIIVALVSVASALAQTVSGVSVSQVENTIVVSYDIDKACHEVRLKVSMDGGKTFSAPLKAVSGDLKNVQPGHRSIVWDVLAERESLKGDDIVFDVVAGDDTKVSDGVAWVDMGLSVKWATCNLGASKPEEYGLYFAFGDVKGQTRNGSSWSGNGFYFNPSYKFINGDLKPKYDAAHVLLGGKWRMPTREEFIELAVNCTSKWTTLNGVKGIILTSRKNGNSIFLPFAGYGENDTLSDVGSIGYYWTRTFSDGHALYRMFYSGSASESRLHQGNGFSVRPVIK